jgi:hypothetical protein
LGSKIQSGLSNGSFTGAAVIGATNWGSGLFGITVYCTDKNFFSSSIVLRLAEREYPFHH